MIKLGIVGTSFILHEVIPALKKVEGIEPYAISSRSLENAQKASKQYNIPHAVEGYEALANLVDAVYLPIPNAYHKEVALFFLKNHIPVMMEKPFALNEKETLEIFKCAKENQTLIMDAIVPLYTDNFFKLKDSLDKVGTIHRVDLIYSQYTSRWDRYLQGEKIDVYLLEQGNGAIMALGIYPISLAVSLFGEPKEVVAKCIFMETGVDLVGTYILQYDTFQIMISASRAVTTYNQSEIAGEKGNLILSIPNRIAQIKFIDRINQQEEDLSCNQIKPMAYEFKEFVNCINQGKLESDIVSHELTLKCIRTMERIRKDMGLKFLEE